MAAAKAILEPIFEADFLPCSFGFRPKRSAHQALEVVRTAANQGAIWVLDADISDCFGSLAFDAITDTEALARDAEARGWGQEAARHRRLLARLDTLMAQDHAES
jgi:hypothetical protein